MSILEEQWTLSPLVEIRSERFGALAYHFGNRKLTFLKTHELAQAVRNLAQYPDVGSALVAAGIPPSEHGAYAGALQKLAASNVIQPRVSIESERKHL
jgi:mycofactocin biosynthesis protein MftB